MEPFCTVNTMNEVLDGEAVPLTIVPPAELLQAPEIFVVLQLAAVTATFVPSGTAFPAASLIPEKVMVAVVPEEMEIELGPEAVAEVVPASWMVPTAKLVEDKMAPLLLAETTATEAVWSWLTPVDRPASEYMAWTWPPATVKIEKAFALVAVVPSPGEVPADSREPPAELMQAPAGVVALQLAAVIATFAPSGSGVTPSESNSPEITTWAR